MSSPKHAVVCLSLPLPLLLLLLLVSQAAQASVGSVYIAQNAAGANTGADCADAHAAVAFFNSSSNWGSGSSQIGQDTVVHVCGTFTGSNSTNSTGLQFKGGGAAGHPVTIVFETGAVMQAPYWSGAGAIDLNGQSHIVINGGPACGKLSDSTSPTTACNGLIRNTLAGSPGASCPAGSCSSQLSGTTASAGIGNSSGNPSDITVENIQIGPIYVKLAGDTTDGGMATIGIGWGGGSLPQGIIIHHSILKQAAKLVVISMGSPASQTTLNDFELYNSDLSDHCWAYGVGANTTNLNITGILYHDNEDQGWDNWAPSNVSGNVCHGNGTMFFNGDGSTIHTAFGFIGDSSLVYNNYVHGNLAGNAPRTSPSGYISCQDNCINIAIFNNLIVDTSTGTDGGGAVYFNGAGGGGQQVYNNTIIRPSGSMVVASGVTANVLVKNNVLQCTGTNCAAIEIRPNTPNVVTSDLNDGFQIGSSSWVVYNSASSGKFLSLATWQSTYGQDTHSTTASPNLDSTYRPQSGSPVIDLGADLSSLGITPLNADLTGISRPSGSAAWDGGVYQFSASGTPPTPPTGLTAAVQ